MIINTVAITKFLNFDFSQQDCWVSSYAPIYFTIRERIPFNPAQARPTDAARKRRKTKPSPAPGESEAGARPCPQNSLSDCRGRAFILRKALKKRAFASRNEVDERFFPQGRESEGNPTRPAREQP